MSDDENYLAYIKTRRKIKMKSKIRHNVCQT